MSEIEHTPEVERVDEDSKKFNRQINFYIMRYMWQVIRGRSPSGKNATIYAELDTSRGRYTRIVDGENIRISKNELDTWVKKTGLPGGVFTGDIRIECVQYVTERKQVVPKTVTPQEWNELFSLRKKRKKAYDYKETTNKTDDEDVKISEEAHSKAKNAYADKEKELQLRLRCAKRLDTDHKEFSKLCYWLKHLEAAPAKLQDEDVRTVTKALKSLTFRKLDDCELGPLEILMKALQEKAKLAKTIFDYKNKAIEEGKTEK